MKATIIRLFLLALTISIVSPAQALITSANGVSTPQILSQDKDNNLRVRWWIQSTVGPVTSAAWEVRDATGSTVLMSNSTATLSMPTAPFITQETIVLPQVDVATWYQTGYRVVLLRRLFLDAVGANQTATVVLRLSPSGIASQREVAGDLQITALDLRFEHQLSPSPMYDLKDMAKPLLRVNYRGQGTLSGRWQIAGPGLDAPLQYRTLQVVEKPLTQAQFVELPGPVLPTLAAGDYRVRFCVIDRDQAVLNQASTSQCPNELVAVEAVYRVIDAAVDVKPIQIEAPTTMAVTRESRFGWQPTAGAAAYELQIFRLDGDGRELVTGMLLPPGSQSAPVSQLMDFRLEPGHRYQWRLQALDAQGNLIGRSEIRDMIYQGQ